MGGTNRSCCCTDDPCNNGYASSSIIDEFNVDGFPTPTWNAATIDRPINAPEISGGSLRIDEAPIFPRGSYIREAIVKANWNRIGTPRELTLDVRHWYCGLEQFAPYIYLGGVTFYLDWNLDRSGWVRSRSNLLYNADTGKVLILRDKSGDVVTESPIGDYLTYGWNESSLRFRGIGAEGVYEFTLTINGLIAVSAVADMIADDKQTSCANSLLIDLTTTKADFSPPQASIEEVSGKVDYFRMSWS